jgi:site-specific DNA-methyltransferase (adenine-specific)
MPRPITQNTLFSGDNLDILREHIADASADLIYLDPPFNSNRNYNVLFKDEASKNSESQITAFEDTWHWNASAEESFAYLVTETGRSQMGDTANLRSSHSPEGISKLGGKR